MTTLVLLPPAAAAPAGEPAVDTAPACAWRLLDADGRLLQQGHGSATDWPTAQETVLQLPPGSVAWHAWTVPKSARKHWQPALRAWAEDHLLGDPAQLHLALAPDAQAGAPTRIAVTDKGQLLAWLQACEQGHRAHDPAPGTGAAPPRSIDRVLPPACPRAPGEPPQAHMARDAGHQLCLRWCDAEQGLHLPLAGNWLRQRLASAPEGTRWSASPDAQQEASALLGRELPLCDALEILQQDLASGWNLRQFEAAAPAQAWRPLRRALLALRQPAWRWARRGAAAALALAVLGPPALAWQQRQAVQALERAQVALLQQRFPAVRAVLDAPAQMSRALSDLRARAGRLGPNDLESQLDLLDRCWPEGLPPLAGLQFEAIPGAGAGLVIRLQTAVPENAQALQALQTALAREGWTLQAEAGDPAPGALRWRLARSAP